MIDITFVVKCVIALATAILTSVFVPWFLKNTSAKQREEIYAWVKIAVSAAEQIFTGSGRGQEKKEYVLNWLKSRNISIDENAIEAMLESAVYELNNSIISS
jgi:biopolymer transport protein ExbD